MAKKRTTGGDQSIIRAAIIEDQGTGVLPAMSPDTFDDFVSWLYERVDLRSFQQSRSDVKAKYYRQFIAYTAKNNPKRLQLLLFSNQQKVK